jgi:hypothetical protein
MREARFKKKGKPVMCIPINEDRGCGAIWIYRGRLRKGWIRCPSCRTNVRIEESLLPTAKRGAKRQ